MSAVGPVQKCVLLLQVAVEKSCAVVVAVPVRVAPLPHGLGTLEAEPRNVCTVVVALARFVVVRLQAVGWPATA